MDKAACIKELKSREPYRRILAAAKLGALGQPEADLLANLELVATTDPNPFARQAAQQAIDHILHPIPSAPTPPASASLPADSLYTWGIALGFQAGFGLSFLYGLIAVALISRHPFVAFVALCVIFVSSMLSAILGAITMDLILWAIHGSKRPLNPRTAALIGLGFAFLGVLLLHVLFAAAPDFQSFGYAYFLGIPSLIYLMVGSWFGKRAYAEMMRRSVFQS